MYDRFFPNYMVANRIIIEQPRPLAAANRYDALLPWLQAHQDLFFSKAQATGMLYIARVHERSGSERLVTASTFFILSFNGRRIPITTLHTIQRSDSMLNAEVVWWCACGRAVGV